MRAIERLGRYWPAPSKLRFLNTIENRVYTEGYDLMIFMGPILQQALELQKSGRHTSSIWGAMLPLFQASGRYPDEIDAHGLLRKCVEIQNSMISLIQANARRLRANNRAYLAAKASSMKTSREESKG